MKKGILWFHKNAKRVFAGLLILSIIVAWFYTFGYVPDKSFERPRFIALCVCFGLAFFIWAFGTFFSLKHPKESPDFRFWWDVAEQAYMILMINTMVACINIVCTMWM